MPEDLDIRTLTDSHKPLFDKAPRIPYQAKELVIASHSAAGGTGLRNLVTVPRVELAANRKALAGDVIGILRGEMERQPEDHPTVLQIGWNK